jgi:hypothetical protein
VSITGFDTKIDGLGEMVKMLTEGQDRVKMLTEGQDRVKMLAKTWERKQGEFGHELRVLEGQRRRNNILIFGVEEYTNEGYFDSLKIVEDVFRMEMIVEMPNWHIDSVTRLEKRKGSRPILVRFTWSSNKYEILLNSRILAGSGIRIDRDYYA